MSIEPATGLVPGASFSVTFEGPLLASHGAFYVLSADTGQQVAGLWSDKVTEPGVASPGYTTDMGNFTVLDFPVRDMLPDQLIVPDGLTPGTYRLCTVNSMSEVCGEVTIETK